MHFCSTYGVSNPLPVSQSLLCYFAAYLGRNGLTHQTIKTYLSAVRYLQIANDLPEPRETSSLPKLKVIANGIRKEQANRPPAKPRLPITPEILRKIRAIWAPKATEHDTIMLWAACCLAFFGFFRIGEITVPSDSAFDPQIHPTLKDIAVDSPSDPSLLQVHLKQSKTDQFRKGIDIFVGRTRNDLCPVAAVLAYIAARGDVSGPLFKFADGRPLTRIRFVAQIRQALESSGLFSQEYAGHSFRIGAATTAAECGVEDSTIKAQGRWRSSAFQVYIRLPRQYLASLSSQLSRDRS